MAVFLYSAKDLQTSSNLFGFEVDLAAYICVVVVVVVRELVQAKQSKSKSKSKDNWPSDAPRQYCWHVCRSLLPAQGELEALQLD